MSLPSVRGSPLLLYYTRRPVKCVLWDIKDSLEGLPYGVFLHYLAWRVWFLPPSQRVPPLLAATHTFIFDLYGAEHATLQWRVSEMKTWFEALSGSETRPQPPVRFSIDWDMRGNYFICSRSPVHFLFPVIEDGFRCTSSLHSLFHLPLTYSFPSLPCPSLPSLPHLTLIICKSIHLPSSLPLLLLRMISNVFFPSLHPPPSIFLPLTSFPFTSFATTSSAHRVWG